MTEQIPEQPEQPEQPSPAQPAAQLPWPGDPWAVPGMPAPSPPRRPQRGTVLRWAVAGLLLVASGAATAVAVSAPERTSIPGLETPGDGRYTFAPQALPQLPDGKPAPSDGAANHRHYADLRALVLSAPREAVPGPGGLPAGSPAAAPPCTDYAKLHDDAANLPNLLATDACRGAATRVWTTKDGTRTEIWLVRFGSADEGSDFYQNLITDGSPKAVPQGAPGVDEFDFRVPTASHTTKSGVQAGPTGAGQPVAEAAYLGSGDVVTTIVMSNPHGVPSQAFRQVVLLQANLLG
ncbi:hypothetical protein [Kitasatospora sp. NBC_01266]|uniref:hypothetical protein n=1 Tax=Kitasatospora sp. NBC_01266 TaxID=2903572 RepID=UPI002E30287D|nr:hypothetical protein [Kitasatospora sp. NBC_01266]